MSIKPSKVLVVRQSPMNAKQWLCQLDCGHDQYVTSKSRPTRQTLRCDKCVMKAREQDHG